MGGNGMWRESTCGGRITQTACDARRVRSELSEMLAVLVVPAVLLSGVYFFFA